MTNPEPHYNREDGLRLLPEHDEMTLEPIPGTWSTGWDISFGCNVSFGPDPDGVLRAAVHVSDAAQRDGMAHRTVTSAQLREMAGFLLVVADDQEAQAVRGRPDLAAAVDAAADAIAITHQDAGRRRLATAQLREAARLLRGDA